MEDPFQMKVIFLGYTKVGKTQICNRLANDIFNETQITTIGVDFQLKLMDFDNLRFRLQLWDTAGLDRFRTLYRPYVRGARAVIFVYDITSRESFENMKNDIKSHLMEYQQTNSIVYMIIGNKTDLEEFRQVAQEEAQNLANEYPMLYNEMSCKDNIGVQEAFKIVFQEVIKIHKPNQRPLQENQQAFIVQAPTRRYNCY